MPGFIIGKKSEQSQTFNTNGKRIPVTYIVTTPCYLVDIKTPSKNGYFSMELGFNQTKKINKSSQGKLAKAGIKTPLRFFKEYRLDNNTNNLKIIEEEKKTGLMIEGVKLFIGEEIKPASFFKKGTFVNISGISKGKGFQGVVRRYKFAGGPHTHGQSDRERASGSIGQTTTPGRVYKGKRMAGRMGGKKTTIKNLEIIDVKEDGLIIKGLVPGGRNGLLEIRSVFDK